MDATIGLGARPVAVAPTARRAARWVPLAGLGAGALVGAVYGVALRAWMRFVSDDPDFTWSGTLFIVGAFTLAMGMCGLVAGGRRRGWAALLVPVRILAVVVSLGCFGGAGIIMLPMVVPAAIAVARRDWPQWLQAALFVIAAAPVVLLFGSFVGELGLGHAIAATISFGALLCVEVAVFAEPYRPSVGRLPRSVRWVAATAACVAALGIAVLVAGSIVTG